MRPRIRFLPLAAVAAALAVAAPADALERIDYAVTIEGTIEYNRADVDDDASLQHDETVDFRTHIPDLPFFGDVAQATAPALGTAAVGRGSLTMAGASGVFLRCTEHTLTDVTGGGLASTWHQDRNVFSIRAIDAFTIRVGGCPSGFGPWDYTFDSGGDPVGVGLFDGAVTLPHARVGEASMTFPLSGAVSGTSCPNAHFNTALCSLTWDATVTFTRTGESEVGDDVEPVPIVPDPPVAPPAVDDSVVLAKAELARSLASASLPFTCASACAGTLTAKARGKRLARRAFTAEPGATLLKVRFDRADRRAIRRAGKVKLTLAVASAGEEVTRTVVLRAAR